MVLYIILPAEEVGPYLVLRVGVVDTEVLDPGGKTFIEPQISPPLHGSGANWVDQQQVLPVEEEKDNCENCQMGHSVAAILRLNSGRVGFYCESYSSDLFSPLLPALRDLPSQDRLGLQNDAFALVRLARCLALSLPFLISFPSLASFFLPSLFPPLPLSPPLHLPFPLSLSFLLPLFLATLLPSFSLLLFIFLFPLSFIFPPPLTVLFFYPFSSFLPPPGPCR